MAHNLMIYIDRMKWRLETSPTEVPEQIQSAGVTAADWSGFVLEFNKVLAENGKTFFKVVGSFLLVAVLAILSSALLHFHMIFLAMFFITPVVLYLVVCHLPKKVQGKLDALLSQINCKIDLKAKYYPGDKIYRASLTFVDLPTPSLPTLGMPM